MSYCKYLSVWNSFLEYIIKQQCYETLEITSTSQQHVHIYKHMHLYQQQQDSLLSN